MGANGRLCARTYHRKRGLRLSGCRAEVIRSGDLFDRAKRVLPGGVNSPVRAFRAVGGTPFFCAHADGFLVKAGSGVATLGLPDSPGVPAELARLTLTAPFNDARAVADLFREHEGRIAAIIVEPYVGNAGFIAPDSDFHPALRAVCDQYGALLIFDEVMTGFRVAPGGAQELVGVD